MLLYLSWRKHDRAKTHWRGEKQPINPQVYAICVIGGLIVFIFLIYFNNGKRSTSPSVESPVQLKKLSFRYRFHILLLTSVIITVFYCYMSDTGVKWWERFYSVQYLRNISRAQPDFKTHLKQNIERTAVAYHYAYPRNYHFVMDDIVPCMDKTFLVLVIPVAPSDLVARNVIRKTWGKETVVQGKQVKTVFLLGLPGGAAVQQQQEKLKEENRLYRDLIQSSFQDGYRNLTIKTMVMLDWLTSRCATAHYAIKIDSDMFLNVHNLVKLLLDPSTPKHNYMTGLVWWHSPVLRDPNNKFYIPVEVFAEPEYPPYPLGMGYVMSLDLPAKILEASQTIRPIYIEDVYLGLCLQFLGILPTDPPEKTMFIVNPAIALSRCDISKVVAVTTTSMPQMMSYWEKSQAPGVPC